MSDELIRFLHLAGLTLWNLFPNGTMLLATWLSAHEIVQMPQDQDEDEDWIPHYGK